MTTDQYETTSDDSAGDEIDLTGLLTSLGNNKRYLVICTLLGFAISVTAALLLPKVFTAKTTILPPQQGASASLAASLGALGALAGSAGGLKSTDDLYASLLKSHSVTNEIIKAFNLQNIYKTETITATRKALDESTRVSADKKSGLITIEIDQKEPELAAKIANTYVDELRKLLTRVSVTEAQQRQAYYKQQAEQAKLALTAAEQAVKQAKDQSGILSLDAQAQASIGAAAQLRAQLVAKEVQLRAMRAYAGPENTEYKRLASEIVSIRSELAKIEGESDQLGEQDPRGASKQTSQENPAMTTVRLLRELKFAEAVYSAMLQQYTIASADVSKEAPLVQQIDAAVPPELKSKPKRALIVALGTMAGLFVGVIFAFLRSSVQAARRDPQSAEKMRALKAAWSFRRLA